MSLPLPDDRLDRVLAELARSSGEEIAAAAPTADDLAERLVGRQALPRRGLVLGSFTVARWQLAALLLLLALAIAGGVAVGALLLRQTSPRLLLLPPHGLDCTPVGTGLPEGQVMAFDVDGGVGSDAPTPTTGTLVLFEDGTLVFVPAVRSQAQVVATDAAMSARRLSQRGVGLVRDAIAESGLLARGCHLDLLSDTPLRGIAVRDSDGAGAATHWGSYGGFLRPMSETEKTAAALLVEQLEAPVDWLPADAWADPEPRPYDPDRWLLTARQVPAERVEAHGGPVDATDLPDVASVHLPGGAGLLDFGAEWQEPDTVVRCDLLDSARARAAARTIFWGDPPHRGGAAWFADGPDRVEVRLEPVLTTQRSCSAGLLGIADASSPRQSPEWAALAGLEPCELVPLAAVEAALREPKGSMSRRRDDFRGSASYVSCVDHREEGWGWFEVAVRTTPTTTAQAPALARLWLGKGAIDGEVAGYPAWMNTCMATAAFDLEDPWCTPAIFVLAEPYFIVVTVRAPSIGSAPANSLAIASQFLPGIIDRLKSLGPARVEP